MVMVWSEAVGIVMVGGRTEPPAENGWVEPYAGAHGRVLERRI